MTASSRSWPRGAPTAEAPPAGTGPPITEPEEVEYHKAQGGFRGVMSHRDFRRLLGGQGVSALGDWMVTVAMMALVLEVSGSSTAVAGVLVLRLAPAALAGPVTTRIVTGWNRRRTMLAMDAMRAGVVVLIPLVRELWWVYLWAFVLEVGGLIFLPARDASIPDLAGEEDLPLANGLILGSSYGTIPLGAGAFGLVAALTGGSRHDVSVWVFVADALTFFVSFWAIHGLRRLDAIDRNAAARRKEEGNEDSSPRFLEAMRLPIIRAVGVPTVVIAVGLGTLFSVGITFVRDVLHASDTQFGWLVALFGVGAGIGLAALELLHADQLKAVRFSVAAQGVVIAGMSLSPTTAIALGGAVLFGAATAAALASAMSVVQERLSDEQRVMAFVVFHTLIRGGLALAAIAAGVVVDLLVAVKWPVVGHLPGARLVLLAAGIVVLLGVLGVRVPEELRHPDR